MSQKKKKQSLNCIKKKKNQKHSRTVFQATSQNFLVITPAPFEMSSKTECCMEYMHRFYSEQRLRKMQQLAKLLFQLHCKPLNRQLKLSSKSAAELLQFIP